MSDNQEKTTTIVNDGNNEVESLKKRLADLEGQNKTLTDFYQQAAPVLQFVATDNELKESFNTKWAKATGQLKEDKKEDKSNPEIDSIKKEVKDIKETNRTQIFKDFEKTFGIDKLTAEEASKKRKAIGEHIRTFGTDLDSIPADKLYGALETAFKTVDPEGVKKAEQAGYTRGYVNGVGSMPTMQGGSVSVTEDGKLADSAKKWAEKLGVDPKRAEEVMKNKENEWNTPSKAEIEARPSK